MRIARHKLFEKLGFLPLKSDYQMRPGGRLNLKVGINRLAPHHAAYLLEVYDSLDWPTNVKVDRNKKAIEIALVLGKSWIDTAKHLDGAAASRRTTSVKMASSVAEEALLQTIRRQGDVDHILRTAEVLGYIRRLPQSMGLYRAAARCAASKSILDGLNKNIDAKQTAWRTTIWRTRRRLPHGPKALRREIALSELRLGLRTKCGKLRECYQRMDNCGNIELGNIIDTQKFRLCCLCNTLYFVSSRRIRATLGLCLKCAREKGISVKSCWIQYDNNRPLSDSYIAERLGKHDARYFPPELIALKRENLKLNQAISQVIKK
jgi:hypothetical protein